MVHKSLESLTVDQRMIGRRGWISREEREKLLAELPDVSSKIGESEEEASGDGEEPSEAGPQAAPVGDASKLP